MKYKTILPILFLVFDLQSAFAQVEQNQVPKVIVKQTLNSYIKQNFKQSITTKKVKIGNYCDGEAYFVEGFSAERRLKERMIVYKKRDGSFFQSNQFFFWCASIPMVAYYSNSTYKETDEDLTNLIISYERGKFLVTNRIIADNDEPEKELIGSQYAYFNDFFSKSECK